MSDFFATAWPLLVVCVVVFVIGMLWIAFVDTIAAGLKKLFGVKERRGNWHTLPNAEADSGSAGDPAEDEKADNSPA